MMQQTVAVLYSMYVHKLAETYAIMYSVHVHVHARAHAHVHV